jgi:hypothetical protein
LRGRGRGSDKNARCLGLMLVGPLLYRHKHLIGQCLLTVSRPELCLPLGRSQHQPLFTFLLQPLSHFTRGKLSNSSTSKDPSTFTSLPLHSDNSLSYLSRSHPKCRSRRLGCTNIPGAEWNHRDQHSLFVVVVLSPCHALAGRDLSSTAPKSPRL